MDCTVGSLSLLQRIFPTQDWTKVTHIAGWFFTCWATGKPKNTGVGSLSLLQQIFPTQESNEGLLHCRQILYQLSYQGSPLWILQAFKTNLKNHNFITINLTIKQNGQMKTQTAKTDKEELKVRRVHCLSRKLNQ